MLKIINRHRGLIAAAAIVLLVLALGSVVSVWQAVRATNAERLAKKRLWEANAAMRQVKVANQRSRRDRAQALSSNASFLAAIKRYDMAVKQFEAALTVDPNSSQANNNYAWFLSTCPNKKYHKPEYGVELAHKALKLVPEEGLFWNTLGVCYYRAGRWEEAMPALERSNKFLGDAGLGFNAMFIAMSHWQLGKKDEANRQFDVAVEWMRENEVVDEELVRFYQEASELLGRELKVPAETAAEDS